MPDLVIGSLIGSALGFAIGYAQRRSYSVANNGNPPAQIAGVRCGSPLLSRTSRSTKSAVTNVRAASARKSTRATRKRRQPLALPPVHVPEHAHDDVTRSAELIGLMHDKQRQRRSYSVANNGKELIWGTTSIFGPLNRPPFPLCGGLFQFLYEQYIAVASST